MKNELDKLLQKQMDRKAFLKHVGIGFVAMTGFATLLKALSNTPANVGDSQKVASGGYGSSVYGGQKPKS